ncbi:MAG: hypothetical protein EXR99_11085 [Gemmataceae bacterium]|nr:hypothetical protein [Gemmataceae bacterium]
MRGFLLALCLLLVVGCGKPAKELPTLHPVTGKVALKSKALADGEVYLRMEEDRPDLIINGLVGEDGAFEISTNQNGKRTKGAPAGKYWVSFGSSGGNNQPLIYAFTSQLEVKAGPNQWDLELSKARKQ